MLSYKYVKQVLDCIKVSKMSRQDMLAIQETRWRKLVHHAFKNSPYYSRIMKERGLSPKTAKPSDFPILTKQLIQEH
ncbi:MAG: hypothetical protein ACXWRE_04395, partial [Pseudobdellovibrionaceae bacterium]